MKKGSEIANRILKKINKEKFKYNDVAVRISISIGVSDYRDDENMDEFIARVDNALYEAKNSGRNCVKIK
jgi:diguanylate cyclase (GGDEF)-like protein